MILTGVEIEREWANGRIVIDPFTPEQVNPNSYNFRLGGALRVYRGELLDARRENEYDELKIPEEGYVLEPGKLYLAHTIETLGGKYYAPTFAARSSVARLGLFINLSASLGDIGYSGQWTLQLYTMNRVRVYRGMNIGQMMWWRPRGQIHLYDGKYQGSVGPRTSDIHLDFTRQLARQRFPGLGATVDPGAVGPKFAELAKCSRDFPVPAAFCVPAAVFSSALSEAQSEALRLAFSDLKATVGAFFADSTARLHAIAQQIRVSDEVRDMLASRLEDVFGAGHTIELAIRSSGLDEDGERSSLAGVHRTVLGVRGTDAVLAALEQCWRSYYDVPAVAARIRAGDFDPRPRLAVMVQALIRPGIAGVAFTCPQDSAPRSVAIEYVEGLADRLVAGVAVPHATSSEALENDPTSPPDRHRREALTQVVDMARRLCARRDGDVDIEWAADRNGVHLLQVRPLTAPLPGVHRKTGPCFEPYRLYLDTPPPSFPMGEVAEVYGSYVAKRGAAYQLASELDVPTGAGWVITFNGAGLREPSTELWTKDALSDGPAECVVDFGNTLRQVLVHKDELLDTLATITGSRSDSFTPHTAVVRTFIRGQIGMISQIVEGGMLVEYTDEGLMALNRGTAGAKTILLADSTPRQHAAPATANGAEVLDAHLETIARFTKAMDHIYGPITLEWVLDGDQPYFVDYSLLDGGDAVHVIRHGTGCISRGTARGPLCRLDDDEMLRHLSIGPAVSVEKSQDVTEHDGLARIIERVRSFPERPIVCAARPYAVLSVLIGHVAGFVFDEGSTLGHLAILLREAGVPAVTAPGITGKAAVISDGTLTTIQHTGAPL